MKIWQHILSKLQANQHVYLLTVIDNEGSSPGRKGFKMMVSEDGFIFGSIGGGVMEFSLVEEVKKRLHNSDLGILFKRQIHRGHKEYGSGMICSGKQTVVFYPLESSNIAMVEDILLCSKTKTKGTLEITSSSINFSKKQTGQNFEINIVSPQDWFFKEQLGYKNTIYIIGGGHVSVAVSSIFVKLGFHVVVFDNRENLNTLELNKSAHQKTIINFHEIMQHLTEGTDSYVAIMTNKYTDDKLVLSKILRANFAYIGVLGSVAKLEAMWNVLQREGFSKLELDQVYAPIGIPIKSQTPDEIAISIAAQVIQIKNINQ